MNNFKRILIASVSALLCASMVACGNTKVEETTAATTTVANGEVTTTTEATEATTEAPAEDKVAVIEPNVDANTLGGKLWAAFVAAKEEKPEISAEELANQLVTNEAIQFMGGAMALEANQEFFNGFDDYKITGYESGAVYMPMIGSIPFIGYVFELAEDADVAAFVQTLSDKANPRWNICVTAEQTVAGAYGTTVFFLMCPTSLEA